MATSPFVTPQWLHNNLDKVRVLDATWYLPDTGRDGKSEHTSSRIPSAQYFDIGKVSDPTTELPHMLPTEEAFAAAADALGISRDDTVVVYEREGLFSAPRAWWMWKAYGHPDARLLEGGLAAWKGEGYELDESEGGDLDAIDAPAAAARARYLGAEGAGSRPPSYPARLNPGLVVSSADVLRFAEGERAELAGVVDARPAARWRGDAAEPRPGMRAGHVPGSRNVPFPDIQRGGKLLPPDELRARFAEAGVDLTALADSGKKLVLSCGSGVTACILDLAIETLEPTAHLAIYDGSWSEWGGLDGVPVAKGAE